MTPREKAVELVNKFNPYVENWDFYNDTFLDHKIILNHCKKSALIVVDEIIKSGNILATELADGYIDEPFNNYWQEVKKEINSL